MNWIKISFKIISYNFFILFLLLISLFIFPYLINKLLNNFSTEDYRASLINYKNIEWAQDHFREFYELKTSYKDFYTWRRNTYNGSTININQHGIRESFSSVNNQNSNLEYLFFGGSTMWGTGSNDKNTIPSIFSKLNNVSVINYGETGYLSIQSLNLLNSLLIKEKLDLKNKVVIFYDGVNNVSVNCQINNLGLETNREEQLNNYIKESKISEINYFLKPIKQIVERITNRFVSSNHENNFRDCDENELKANLVANNLVNTWKLANQIVKENGGKFIPVLQPVIYIGNVKKNHILDKLEKDSEANFKIVYEIIKSKSFEYFGNKFIDLSDTLDDKDFYYIDYCHISPNGNLLVAKNLTLKLKQEYSSIF